MLTLSGSLKAIETNLGERRKFGINFVQEGTYGLKLMDVLPFVATIGGSYLIGEAVTDEKATVPEKLGAGLATVLNVAGGVIKTVFAQPTGAVGAAAPPPGYVLTTQGYVQVPTSQDIMSQLGQYMPLIMIGGTLIMVVMLMKRKKE